MKTIIAGSREIKSYELVYDAVLKSGFNITEVVCGGARGVDALGKQFAEAHKIPVRTFAARWTDLNAPNAFIKTRDDGTRYNHNAGYDRNVEMANYADALIAVPRRSLKRSGTWHMIYIARQKGLKLCVLNIETMEMLEDDVIEVRCLQLNGQYPTR